ncbi:MAG TPA: hypothetical protein VGK09_15195 [Rhodocyclaceae bacterium]
MSSHSIMAPRRTGQGFSLLELLAAGLVILLLFGFLNTLLARYQGQAEQEMVDLTLRNLRISLRLQVATFMVAGRMNEVAKLGNSNPIVLLDQPPANYQGEVDSMMTPVQSGWFFDRARSQLVYRPQSQGFPGGNQQELRWRILFLPGQDAGARLVDEHQLTKINR